MCNKNIHCFGGCSCTKDAGLLFLRIAIGVPFIAHGLTKLLDIPGTTQFLTSLNLSPTFSYIVGGGELLAGLMILLGIWSYVGGWLVSIIMICAYTLLKNTMPFLGGYELDFVFFFGGLAIAMLGSGRYALIGGRMGKTTLAGTPTSTTVAKETNALTCECDGKGGCSDGVCTTCPGCNPNFRP